MLLKIKQFKATSSTRRHSYSGQRKVPRYAWDVAILKDDLISVGWWSSKPESIPFRTICSPTHAFCELEKYLGKKVPMPDGIHLVYHQQGNYCRVRPYLGMWFDRLPTFDPDTLVEYIPDNDRLRIHYPPALRPFQYAMFSNQVVVRKFMELTRANFERV